PRKVSLARCADYYAGFRPGTDVAFFNGLLHVIFREGLEDEAFIARRTEGVEALRRTVASYTPERVEGITGVRAGLVEEIARVYGSAERAITFWGMWISQHTTGTDNARSLVNLALVTGNVGRPGTGLHPLRGQNNVQGASDVGLIPIVYTDYQPVKSPEARAKFEKAWGVTLGDQPGLTVVEIMHEALAGRIRGMYIMGENPFLSDPNTNKVKKALAALGFLVVQDIFLTQTARYADVVLPATAFPEKTGTYTNTDRRVQLGRKALEPPGQARADWEVVAELGRRMGYPMSYGSAEEVFEEIRSVTPSMAGITYARLEGEGGINWPCPEEGHPGSPLLFAEAFPSGRGKLVPCEWKPAHEGVDGEYPLVLNTGRMLEHWHTGSMTRRAKALDALQPDAIVEMHPDDLEAAGAKEGGFVRVASRRGEIRLRAVGRDHMPRGSVFIPFHFEEAAANLLTIDALDPFGKIPEFKYCAVRVEADGEEGR
ncbi:MAG: molybdopterin oxidoreductase family protein, partial [Nitrospinota bacterium]